MTKQQFIAAAIAAARQSSASSSFLPGVAVAQAALESAWGESRLALKAKNYFGIKGHAAVPCISMPTSECVNGVFIKTVARFARFESMAECFAERDRIIASLPVYAEARGHAAEPVAFVHSLAKHWATDPGYAEKVLRIYRENGFDKLDQESISAELDGKER